MSDNEVVYDPLEIERKVYEHVGAPGLTLQDLCQPASVQLLLMRLRSMDVDIRAKEHKLDGLRQDNKEQRDDRERLRIELAALKERSEARQGIHWVEMLMSVAIGYAVNSLISNPGDRQALVMLIVSALVVIILAGLPVGASIFAVIQGRKEANDA